MTIVNKIKILPVNVLAFYFLTFVVSITYIPYFFEIATSGIWENPAFSHGPLVLFISLFLIWSNREKLFELTVDGVYFSKALPFIAVGIILYSSSMFLGIQHLGIASFIFIMIGLFIFSFGLSCLRVMIFPFLFIFLMVPMPGFIFDPISSFLKLFVSEISVGILYFFEYPIAQDGVVIAVGHYKLFVADACSGMRTLFMLETLGILYLYLIRHRSWWRDVGLTLLIIPISVFANVLRVIALILITYYFGDEAGQGFMHDFAGFALFFFGFIMLAVADVVLRFFTKERKERVTND